MSIESEYLQVCEFMETAGQPIGSLINLTEHVDLIKFRFALIKEEVNELLAAVHVGDNVEVVDALVDILYVTHGSFAALGFEPCEIENEEKKYLQHLIEASDLPTDLTADLQSDFSASLQAELQVRLGVIMWCVGQICHMYHVKRREAFDAVHQNNMTKFCDTIEEAELTVLHYEKLKRHVHHIKRGAKYVILDDAGKVLKSVKYTGVILRDFINFQELL